MGSCEGAGKGSWPAFWPRIACQPPGFWRASVSPSPARLHEEPTAPGGREGDAPRRPLPKKQSLAPKCFVRGSTAAQGAQLMLWKEQAARKRPKFSSSSRVLAQGATPRMQNSRFPSAGECLRARGASRNRARRRPGAPRALQGFRKRQQNPKALSRIGKQSAFTQSLRICSGSEHGLREPTSSPVPTARLRPRSAVQELRCSRVPHTARVPAALTSASGRLLVFFFFFSLQSSQRSQQQGGRRRLPEQPPPARHGTGKPRRSRPARRESVMEARKPSWEQQPRRFPLGGGGENKQK